MTLKELSQLYHLNREIKMDQERLMQLRAKIASPGSPNNDGMPKSQSMDNRLERYIAEIVDLETIIQSKITQCIFEQKRLERYISEIPDSLTRQIFKLRFVDRESWTCIALAIGGGNTEESVRKRVYRHLKREGKDEK